jgi:hypothetical protein
MTGGTGPRSGARPRGYRCGVGTKGNAARVVVDEPRCSERWPGFAAGEALGLRWQHVNLKDRSLKVAATLGRVGTELVVTEPKTERSRRRSRCRLPLGHC